LIEHEAVKEVAAIGLPDERLGEEVAVVVHLHGVLSEAELLAFARERLAAFKVPTRVIFTDQPLPRNATNKIMKPLLKKGIMEQLGLEA
jgi:long-chain acyl-CoA synthetase